MTDLRAAAEMALNAMQAIDNEHPYPITKLAIVQLSKALAQPEQEPESWMGITDNPYCDDADCNDPNGRAMRWHNKLLYLRKQEHTTPPSKEWVSLTDEEVMVCNRKSYEPQIGLLPLTFYRAIEAALKEKNGDKNNT